MNLNPLEWLKLPIHVLWGLVVVVGLLLWGPAWFVDGLGLEPFISENRKFIGVAFLVLLAPTLSSVFVSMYRKGREEWLLRALNKHRIERLRSLTPPEKAILKTYIAGQTRTQPLGMQSGVVQGLVSAGILVLGSQVGYSGFEITFDYNMQSWAWEYLNKNPDVLS